MVCVGIHHEYAANYNYIDSQTQRYAFEESNRDRDLSDSERKRLLKKELNNLSAHQQMSGSRNYGTFTQWNSMQQGERRSLYPLQQHGWNWRALC